MTITITEMIIAPNNAGQQQQAYLDIYRDKQLEAQNVDRRKIHH
ncbi:hypothetical protein O6V14_16085 [Sphingomonas faeni]